jgi:hypothetical protein
VNAHEAKLLREPFPEAEIGQLPKGGVMLDYVGHAATTNRLLQVDPGWTWEPFAVDERGLPALDFEGNLWIRLTVCGLTRPGVGDGRNMKERIGDAIRNAAMRFGVALDLWAKEDLDAGEDGQQKTRRRRKGATESPAPGSATPSQPDTSPSSGEAPSEPAEQAGPPPGMTDAQRRKMMALFRELGFEHRDQRLGFAGLHAGRSLVTSGDLTVEEATRVIDQLLELQSRRQADNERVAAEGA